MLVAERLMTIEEFIGLPNDGKKYELVKGVLVEVCRPKPIHGRIASRIDQRLSRFVEAHKLGMVTVESGYIVSHNPDSLRGPDVAFISTERLADFDLNEYIPVSPDLVIEIISENDQPIEIESKIHEYLSGGSSFVWVVYPQDQTVVVFDDSGDYETYDRLSTLEGRHILPGFKLPVAEIFEGIIPIRRTPKQRI
jgi:Uma2 family endonuclease